MLMLESALADPWTALGVGVGVEAETSLGVGLGLGLGVPVAIGGEITPGSLLGAYRRGLFCQPRTDPEQIELNRALYEPDVRSGDIPVLPGGGDPYALLWWSPPVRYVIPADGVRLGRTSRRAIRACGWTTSVDTDFDAVITACRGEREPRWITDELITALRTLHAAAWVRTIEVRDGDRLVGGLFGCALDGVFVMDSAFHIEPEAAKVAIADLARRTRAGRITLLDTQVRTEYTVRMGATAQPRDEYLARLGAQGNPGVISAGTSFARDLVPVVP
jgi:leucyl/phenylalanyl-tRNA--protein transferase